MAPKLTDKNLYELFEVPQTATEQEIRQAYRKKALKCHPDKNPDNPKAHQLFLELSDALLILVDPKAKAAYDQTLRGREAAKLRTKELDAKRRKLKEDLERREKEAKEASASAKVKPESSEDALKFEIERLKKEGSSVLREEQENLRNEIHKENQKKKSFIQSSIPVAGGALTHAPRLKIKWKSSNVMSYDQLMSITSKCGKVTDMVVMKKSALVEFSKQEEAEACYEFVSSDPDNSLTVEWISKVIPASAAGSGNTPKNAPAPTSSTSTNPQKQSFEEFEAQILKNLSEAIKAQRQTSQQPV